MAIPDLDGGDLHQEVITVTSVENLHVMTGLDEVITLEEDPQEEMIEVGVRRTPGVGLLGVVRLTSADHLAVVPLLVAALRQG